MLRLVLVLLFASPLVLLSAAAAPVDDGGTTSHCTGTAVSDPEGCVGAAKRAAACRVYLVGAPPSFITFPDPEGFRECVRKSDL